MKSAVVGFEGSLALGVLASGFPGAGFIARGWCPAAFVTAGFRLAFVFILVSPCAGRHLLSLLRQRK